RTARQSRCPVDRVGENPRNASVVLRRRDEEPIGLPEVRLELRDARRIAFLLDVRVVKGELTDLDQVDRHAGWRNLLCRHKQGAVEGVAAQASSESNKAEPGARVASNAHRRLTHQARQPGTPGYLASGPGPP